MRFANLDTLKYSLEFIKYLIRRYKMKKTIIKSIIIFTLFTTIFTTTGNVFAAERQTETTNFELVKALEPYVEPINEKFVVKKIPVNLYRKYGVENIKAVLANVNMVNGLLASEELSITENGTLYQTDNDQFSIQGPGRNGISFHWWGYQVLLSASTLKTIINFSNKYSYENLVSVAGGVLTKLLGCSGGVGLAVAASIALSITVVKHVSDNGLHGIAFNRPWITGIIIPWRQ
jgi:hypothetical protein